MKNTRWARVAQRTIQAAAVMLRDSDANSEGVDDALAVAFNYLSGVIDAIVRGNDLPRMPVELLSLVGSRIRVAPNVMRYLSVPLGLAQVLLENAYEDLRDDGVRGKALVLMFGADLIGAILTGMPVPEPSKEALQAK